jgi:hypothetical protein
VFRTQNEGFTEPSRGPPHDAGPMGCTDQNGNVIEDQADCVTSDEGSFVWVGDVWGRVRYGPWYGEAEAEHVGGESTGGVPFPAANRRKEAAIDGAALRLGYLTETLDVILEMGHSSGDDDMTDRKVKQRALHPDYNVGLILFEEVMRERAARAFGPPFFSAANPDGARGFMSGGGIINATYIQPKVRYRPGFGGFEFVGAVLMAWLDDYSAPPNIFTCPVDQLDADGGCSASKLLGTELDLAVKSRFMDDHLDFSLETGYLMFGPVLKTRTAVPHPSYDYSTVSDTTQAGMAGENGWRGVLQISARCDLIPEAAVAGLALERHPRQHRYARVDVVVDDDLALGMVLAVQAANILGERAPP